MVPSNNKLPGTPNDSPFYPLHVQYFFLKLVIIIIIIIIIYYYYYYYVIYILKCSYPTAWHKE